MNINSQSQNYIADLIEKIKLTPKDTELRVSLGEAYLLSGQTKKAQEEFQKAAQLDPTSNFRAAVWEWSGYIHKKEGNTIKSITDYTQWSQADLESCRPLDRLGTVLVKENLLLDLQILFSLYKKRYEATDNPYMLESMALLFYVLEPVIQSEDASALSLAGEALEKLYNSISLHYLMGLLYSRTGDVNGALTQFQKVEALDTEHTWRETRFGLNWTSDSANLEIAKTLASSGLVKEAAVKYIECLKADRYQENIEILEKVLSLLINKGNECEVIRLFKDAKEYIKETAEEIKEQSEAQEYDKKPSSIKIDVDNLLSKISSLDSFEENGIEEADENTAKILYAFLEDFSIFDSLFGELDEKLQLQTAEILCHTAERTEKTVSGKELNFRKLRRIYAHALFKCGCIAEFNEFLEKDDSEKKTKQKENSDEILNILQEISPKKDDSQKTKKFSEKNAAKKKKAQKFLEDKNFAQAEKAFRALMASAQKEGITSEYAASAIGCAQAEFNLKKYDSAVEILEAVLKEDLLDSSVKAEVFDLMAQCFDKRGQKNDLRSKRLCILQKISLLREAGAKNISKGIMVPLPAPMTGTAFITAQACSGSGKITGSFIPGSSSIVTKTWCYIKSQAQKFGLPDLSACDICIDMRIESNEQIPEQQPESIKADSEDFSLGLFAAIICAVKKRIVLPDTLVCGSLDLLGILHASADAYKGLRNALDANSSIKRLVISEQLIDDLHYLPLETLTIPTFAVCQNADQILDLVNSISAETETTIQEASED